MDVAASAERSYRARSITAVDRLFPQRKVPPSQRDAAQAGNNRGAMGSRSTGEDEVRELRLLRGRLKGCGSAQLVACV